MKYKSLVSIMVLLTFVMTTVGCINYEERSLTVFDEHNKEVREKAKEKRVVNTLNIYNNATKLEVLEQETFSCLEYYEEHLQLNDVICNKKVLFDANSCLYGSYDRRMFTIEIDNKTTVVDTICVYIVIIPDSIENRLFKGISGGEPEMCLFLNESTSREIIKDKYSISDDGITIIEGYLLAPDEIIYNMIHGVLIEPELTEEDFK